MSQYICADLVRQKIYHSLSDIPITANQIATSNHVHAKSVYRHLNGLMEENLVAVVQLDTKNRPKGYVRT